VFLETVSEHARPPAGPLAFYRHLGFGQLDLVVHQSSDLAGQIAA
jgi:hypothetical protein